MGLSLPAVLIVDTDPHQIELVSDLIRDVVRAHVDTTNSGERALELLSRGAYQIVIVDCALGDVDGISILERVKRVSPSTSVIITSPFASIEEAVKAVRYGAEEYFKKPFDPEALKMAIKRSLDRRQFLLGDTATSGLMHLLNTCQLISGSLEEERVLDTVMSYLKIETGAEAIALFKKEKELLKRIPSLLEKDPDVVEVLAQGHGAVHAMESKSGIMVNVSKTPASPEIAFFQFQAASETIYVVACLVSRWKISPEEAESRFRLLNAQIQMTAKNIKGYQNIHQLLRLDEPTGLYNSRFLHQVLDSFFEKSGDEKKFSVLFIDLDHFKQINDQFGHLVGTRLLEEVAQVIQLCTRKADLSFRYGGDEFVVVLPGTSAQEAVTVAEKIRETIEKKKFLSRENLKIHLTASIGIANCPEHASSKRDVIAAADQAMYAVKRKCRNSVYLANSKAA